MDSPSNISIRAFTTTADYDAAIRLWENMDGVTLNESGGRQEIAAFIVRNRHAFVAIAKETDLVGTILCRHNDRAGQIYHSAVAEKHRNKGTARADEREPRTLVHGGYSSLQHFRL